MLNELNIPDKIRTAIEKALVILKSAGCSEIYLFGSIAEGKYVEGSDIDIAVRNLDKNRYFEVFGEILTEIEMAVDLVVLDYKNDFVSILQKEGTFKRVS